MKRGYSREFKPHGDTGKRYLLDQIPAGLWREVREACKREGVSVRALILRLLSDWVRARRGAETRGVRAMSAFSKKVLPGEFHNNVAKDVRQLRRGRVWCLTCGSTMRVDAGHCLAHGWPKCCGYTMTIDSPSERRRRTK